MTQTLVGASRKPLGRSLRLIWLLPAGFALLLGLDAGLLLLGLPAPVTTTRLPEVHGMLLVLGFVGTLISLERAVALGRWYGYLAPALLAGSGILLVIPAVPLLVGKAGLVAGTTAFTLLYLPLWRRQYDMALLTQLLGAGLGLVGAVVWLGDGDFVRVLPWVIGFIILTIAAERVELARITMGEGAGFRLLLHAWAITLALLIGLVLPDAGAFVLGTATLLLAAWLIVHDIARRTVRASGVTRYMAACILAGYVWLTLAGVLLLFGTPSNPLVYDAVIHSVFLGYTFSMIMAHSTTILPAVLGIRLPYSPAFWVPIVILQMALIVRILLGDAFGIGWAWQLGGALGVAALLVFALTAVGSVVWDSVNRSRKSPAAPVTPDTPANGADK